MNEKEAIELLKKHSNSDQGFKKVLGHSRAVQTVALRLANDIPNADVEFIRVASLLHDIGRFECPPGEKTIFHGVIGAKILRDEGMPEKYAMVCERHLGAGISKNDITEQGLDLPLKDYSPVSLEEKIITVADNLIFGDVEKSFDDVYEKFKKEVNKKTADKARVLHDEIIGKLKK